MLFQIHLFLTLMFVWFPFISDNLSFPCLSFSETLGCLFEAREIGWFACGLSLSFSWYIGQLFGPVSPPPQ